MFTYWMRKEIDGVVYFATEADSPAEGAAQNDKQAIQVSEEEYRANVPTAVHDGQDRTEEARPSKDEVWHNLMLWQAQARLPLPDQIFMLEIMSFNLKYALSRAMTKQEDRL